MVCFFFIYFASHQKSFENMHQGIRNFVHNVVIIFAFMECTLHEINFFCQQLLRFMSKIPGTPPQYFFVLQWDQYDMGIL